MSMVIIRVVVPVDLVVFPRILDFFRRMMDVRQPWLLMLM
jgi:hypothetical protein